MPLIALLLCMCSLLSTVCAVFTEQLTLRPLPAINQVLGRFEFSVDENSQPYNGVYADWRYGSAQSANGFGFTHAPFGTRLQVVILRGDTEAQQRWRGITSELSGIFSASLSQMNEAVVTGLLSSSTPHELGAFPMTNADSAHVFLHGSLAREELCTENLTPWLKMLPCREISGLGSLIDPINALSGEHLSLSLFAMRSSDGRWILRQHLTTVQNFSEHKEERWNLDFLFFANGEPSTDISACSLAEESVIQMKGMESPNKPLKDSYKAQQDVVSVHRFTTGYGQVRGGITVQLKNNHPSCDMHVTYHDVIPWYLRTFQANASGNELKAQELIQSFEFVPAELRSQPNQLRLTAFLPANHTLVFSLEMEKVFLRLSEHPPDANQGFDISSGVATFEVDLICGKDIGSLLFTITLYTEPLLVPLPTPDFSMPYNVITMTSTVVAFFVGTMLNALLRKAPRLK
ncbi:unnamed protein product [Peronospora destructor]|uniref:GPI transamidase component PIG-T n=1 Tax=Peronospora destructor TaxID=86335 RepID=A0AAV0VEL0_9STRA|nr:unnamed protein product [Peronospora destructor]